MRLPLKSELEKIEKVNVPSAAIHISGKLTGFQRKAWMCFFAIARMNPDEVTHSCLVKDLVKKAGYGSTNLKRLREDLKTLTTTPVSWDIFNKEETVRMGDSQMVADIEFLPGQGIVEWSMAPKLKRLLMTELKMYLQVNLSFLPDLRGHEVAIYLTVNDYINKKRNFGKKFVTLEDAKKMLGLDPDEYPNPGDLLILLNRNKDKVNIKSDINVEIEAERGTRNKIIGFMFSGRVKDEYLDFYQSSPKSSFVPSEELTQSTGSILHFLSAAVKENLAAWDFVFYPDVLSALEKLLLAPFNFQPAAVDSYLLFLVDKVEKQVKKNEAQGTKGNPGGLLKRFIVSEQHLDAFILRDKQLQIKAAEKQEQEQNEQKSLHGLVLQEFQRIHTDKNLDAFMLYLQADLERFAPQLEEIAKKDKALQFRLKGKKLSDSLREKISPSVRSALLNYQEDLGFCPEPFDAENYLQNPKYEALKSKYLKEEIKVSG